MQNKQHIIDRIDALIQKADRVVATHRPNPPGVIGFPTLSDAEFSEWQTQALSFLINTLGANHVYVENFRHEVKKPYVGHANSGKGILRAVKEDVEGGYLQNIQSLISADIFTDFLEMAAYLLEEGYKDAAAVLIGSTLEGHLRQLCVKNTIDVEVSTSTGVKPKKADQMNSDLAKANVYGKLDQKNVTAWLDLRNKAAHGEYSQYSKEQVVLFLSGVRDFITRVPA